MRNVLLGLALSLSALALAACSGVTPPPGGGDTATSTATDTATTTAATSATAATTTTPAPTGAPSQTPSGNPSCDKPERKYMSRDPQKCAVMRFFCENGHVAFHDDCGCGCEPPH